MDQENGKQNNTDDNIWDKVFKTFLQEIPQMVLPLINEAFQEDYAMDSQVISLDNEFYNADGSRVVSDTSFQVNNRLYHFECQFSNDTEMAFRMFEYDFHIALSDAKRKSRIDEFVFPKSCVVYITTNKNNPKNLNMKIIFPNGEFIYEVPTVRVHDYSVESISEKKLLIFLPYLVLRFQQKLKNKKKPTIEEIKKFFDELINAAEDAKNIIGVPQYNVLLGLIRKTEQYVFQDYPDIMKEVDPLMTNLLNLQSVEMKWAYEQQARELEQQARELEQQAKELEQQKRATEQQAKELEQQKRATEQAAEQAAEKASLSNIEMLKQFGIILTDEQVQAMLKHAVGRKTEE